MKNYETKNRTPIKKNQKRQDNKNNNSSKLSQSKSQSKGQKRPIQQTLIPIPSPKKDSQQINEYKPIVYSLKELLKQIQIAYICENCLKIKKISEIISNQQPQSTPLVNHCLRKFFHHKLNNLWGNKYAPSNVDEIQSKEFSKKIQQWIKDFYLYKQDNFDNDEQFDFIDDRFEQQYSKSIQDRMRQYGWSCRALILKGRSGVGKTTFLKAVAKSLKINWFQYASDLDQFVMMRERSGYTESECVTTLGKEKKQQQIKKVNEKLMKQNKSITKYFPFQSVNTTPQTFDVKQAKRLEIFRNFQKYFPNARTQKKNTPESYFKFLNESIQKTKIPYALTTNEEQFLPSLPQQKKIKEAYLKNDIVQFVEMSIQDMTNLYWIIFHIEKYLKFDSTVKISKSEVFNELNKQFEKVQFENFLEKQILRKVVLNANKKFTYINNFLQFRIKPLIGNSRAFLSEKLQKQFQKTNIQEKKNNLQKMDEEKHYIDIVGIDKLLDNLHYEVFENLTGERIINDIDWNIESQNLGQKITQIIESEPFSLSQLQNFRQKSQLKVLNDKKQLQNPYTLPIQVEQNKKMNIPIETHRQAKRKILKNVKIRYKYSENKILRLKPFQLPYIPMLFKNRKNRSTRKETPERSNYNLKKLLSDKQLKYMKVNGNFFYPL